MCTAVLYLANPAASFLNVCCNHACTGVDQELVGKKVQIWWPDEHKWFMGVVDYFDNFMHGGELPQV
jgi:hypothetical protein